MNLRDANRVHFKQVVASSHLASTGLTCPSKRRVREPIGAEMNAMLSGSEFYAALITRPIVAQTPSSRSTRGATWATRPQGAGHG